MANLVDLHTHSTASDGSLTPTELVAAAARDGLRAMAITDHDTVGGVAEALAAGGDTGVEVIPGIEISTDFRGKVLHVLGFLMNTGDADFLERLNWAQSQRETRNERMVARFNELGIDMTLDEVVAAAGDGVIGRPHFASVLVRRGVVASFDEAFNIYLKRGGKAYLPKVRFSAPEAIGIIARAGGLAVLAHPGLIGWTPLELDDAVGELRAAGLVGVEVVYSEHSPSFTSILLDMVQRHGLLPTGGSDFHGDAKPGIRLGRGRGDLPVPYEWVTALRERARA